MLRRSSSLSDCQDDSAERAALNLVAQSIGRFSQRECLSHDRFDRAGSKQRDDSLPGVSQGRLRLIEQYEALDAGLFPDQICDVNGCLAACRIPQCGEASSHCKRSERVAQDFTADPVDDNVCAVTVCDTTHAVTQLLPGGINDLIESECLRQHGFAGPKTSAGESHLRGEIRDRNTRGAHIVDTLRDQAKAFLPYGKPLTVGSILENAVGPSEHHT